MASRHGPTIPQPRAGRSRRPGVPRSGPGRLLAACAAGVTALVGLGLSGCRGASAEAVLAETAASLREIRSGTLTLRLVVDPVGQDGGDFGFELTGPFALPRAGELPVGRLLYTQIADGRRGSATFLSTGRDAFVQVGGSTYELPPAQVRELRGAAGELARGEGLGELSVGDWIEGGERSDGGTVGGAETERVRGRLNTVNAVNDLLDLARDLGRADLERIQGRNVRRLSEATRSATFDLYSGKDDGLLRRLRLDVDFGLNVPKELESALGTVVGAGVEFELGVSDPNRTVTVARPANARPYSELPG